MISLKHQNWFIYFKIAWWNGETPSLHRILHRIASHGMPWSPKISKNVLQAPEVVVALLGHGAMMAKFCHLEASPQNNEACGWMAGADGCGWRSKKWSSLAVYLLGVSETMLVLCQYNHNMSHEKNENIHFTVRKNVKKIDQVWQVLEKLFIIQTTKPGSTVLRELQGRHGMARMGPKVRGCGFPQQLRLSYEDSLAKTCQWF